MNKKFYIILTTIIFSNLAVNAAEENTHQAPAGNSDQASNANVAQAHNPHFNLAAFLATPPEEVAPKIQPPENLWLSISMLRQKRKFPIPKPDPDVMAAARGLGPRNQEKTADEIARKKARTEENNAFALLIQHGLNYTCSTGESGKCYPIEGSSPKWFRWTRRPFLLEEGQQEINNMAKTKHNVVPPAIGPNVTLIPSTKGRNDVVFELASSAQIPFYSCPTLKLYPKERVSLFNYPLLNPTPPLNHPKPNEGLPE